MASYISSSSCVEETSYMKLSIKLQRVAVITLLSLGGCKSQKFSAPMKLGGKWVAASTLNHGYDVYMFDY